MDPAGLGRFLMLMGGGLVVVGALLALSPRLPWLGHLPGDFVFGGERWKVYVPLGTSLVLSLVLSLLLGWFSRK